MPEPHAGRLLWHVLSVGKLAQAWLTAFPMLLFPTLLEEKIGEARRCGARQRLPRHKS